MEASSKIILDIEILKPRRNFDNIFVIGKEPFSGKECIGIVGIGEKMKLEDSVNDAFQGSYKIVQQLTKTIYKDFSKEIEKIIFEEK